MKSSSPSRVLPVILFILGLLAVGCAKPIAMFRDLAHVHSKITERYKEDVNVNVSGDTLVVSFINSPLNNQSEEQQEARAKETALLVKANYADWSKVRNLGVSFIRNERRFIVVNYTEPIAFLMFDTTAPGFPEVDYAANLEEPAADPADGDLTINANYSEQRNETDISVVRLQLEGDMTRGIAMAPHFVVKGEASATSPAPPPQFVSIDFASFSEKSLFLKEVTLEIWVDDARIHQERVTFSTSKAPSGMFSEFLMLKVSYQEFERMVYGYKVVFRVGDKEFVLTQEQREAMRAMTKYVKS